MEKEKEYYSINSPSLAKTLSYLLQENPKIFDDTRVGSKGKKVYNFKNTKRFKEVLTMVNKIKNN
ncbi:UNVERIFIED_ORG: hypothetical protein B2H93_14760 [Clostridium botulinum]